VLTVWPLSARRVGTSVGTMRIHALFALMMLGWAFPADGQDLTFSKQILDRIKKNL
jgi:hypothetical protein